jgi:hypothetical protein
MTSIVRKPQSTRLGWPRTIAIGFALIFVCFSAWDGWYALGHPLPVDFLSFYAAGKMVLQGNAPLVYDIAAHRAVELRLVSFKTLLPFPYPPPMLALLTPLALLPCGVAHDVWALLTAILFFTAARRFAPMAYASANPVNIIDWVAGQTGFLIGGIFLFGLVLLDTAPLVAGSVLGLLVLKPQLAIMLPIAMLAARRWRTIGGAVISSTTVLLIGFLLFGIESYRGFFGMVQQFGAMLNDNRWPWTDFISPFAFARYFGIPYDAAIEVHLLFALAAAAIVWIAWARDWDEKVPMLAAATMLGSPYLLSYDATLLVVPTGYLVAQRQYWALGLLGLLCALPLLFIWGLYHGPNTIGVGAIGALAVLCRKHCRASPATRVEFRTAR